MTASFNTTVRQMTEMCQQKVTEMSQRKKAVVPTCLVTRRQREAYFLV